MRKFIFAVAAAALFTGPALGQDKHDHDHGGKHDHAHAKTSSVAAGVKAIDAAIAETRAVVAKGDLEALHETSEEVAEVAEGLAARIGDVSAENRERFKFNTDQLKTLGTQLHDAHEAKDKDGVERVVKRMESVRDRIKTLAPAG